MIIVASGTIINYPLAIFFAWLLIGQWQITDPVVFGTLTTIGFSFVATTRIYTIRFLSEARKNRNK